MTGSLVFDVRPRFKMLMSTPVIPERYQVTEMKEAGDTFSDVRGILSSLPRLAHQISEPAMSPAQGAVDIANSVLVLAHSILTLPRAATGMPQTTAVREIIRVTALAFVSFVLAASSQDTLYSPRHRLGQLRALLLLTKETDWIGMQELKLWVVVIGAMAEDGEDHTWLISLLLEQMRACGLSSWEELHDVLQRFAWSDSLAAHDVGRIETEVKLGLRQLPH